MRPEYTSEQLLPLSGIQHFVFCRRQWSLIHVEQQWQENVLTTEGKLMHGRADDPFFTEVRHGVITARSMPVASYRLGFYGICDVVEFTQESQGVQLPDRQGFWQPAPVEYKRGKQKSHAADEAQLCAQAMCLEEMLSIEIPYGYLYYGQTRRRVQVELGTELRELVAKMSAEMHAYYGRGYTPKAKLKKACQSCSLINVCLPEMDGKLMPAKSYIEKQLAGD